MTFFERSEAARVYQKALRSEAAASEEQEKEEKERRTSAIRLGPKPVTFFDGSHEVEEPS